MFRKLNLDRNRPSFQVFINSRDLLNLFLVSLDNGWYRYHHLFRDALYSYLSHEYSLNDLHRRASQWFMQQNLMPEAIHHTLESEDFAFAANLIESIWAEMDFSYQSATWRRWVAALPEALILQRPLLCLGYGWAMLNNGELEGAETWFQRAEHSLHTDNHEQDFGQLTASFHSARAYRALALGDISATLRYANQAMKLDVDAGHVSQSQAKSLAGIAHWSNGDLALAEQALGDFIAEMRGAGRFSDAIEIVFIVADIQITQGRLLSAYQTYEQTFRWLAELGNPLLMGMEDLHRGVSDLHREWGDFDLAEDHLMGAEELSEELVIRLDWHHRLNLSWAQLRMSQGNFDEALQHLDTAERHYIRTPLPVVRSADAMKARIWIRQGNLAATQDWVHRKGLSIEDAITYQNEYDQITLVRLLIARSDNLQVAQERLERLASAAQDGERMGSLIEIRILQALTHQANGETSRALDALTEALHVAEPQAYCRVFVDEGEPMQRLLANVPPNDYTQQLQYAFASTPSQPHGNLIDPLSERELDVLRLLITEMSGPELARELTVSLNTLRTHTKKIYSKLNVNSRRAAVRRARELGLL